MYWFIGLFAFGAWWSLFLHELSHAIVMKAVGCEITSFKAYPHREDGTFWFGRVRCRYQGKKMPEAYRYSHIAPLAKSSTLMVGWAFLAWLAWWPLFALAACELVDHLWWWIGSWRPGKDAYKWWRRELS
jgi:hypothetical protein